MRCRYSFCTDDVAMLLFVVNITVMNISVKTKTGKKLTIWWRLGRVALTYLKRELKNLLFPYWCLWVTCMSFYYLQTVYNCVACLPNNVYCAVSRVKGLLICTNLYFYGVRNDAAKRRETRNQSRLTQSDQTTHSTRSQRADQLIPNRNGTYWKSIIQYNWHVTVFLQLANSQIWKVDTDTYLRRPVSLRC